jgi:phage terminase small subunit|tara:strand:- start:246 stop:656 length:411 start_codon:yes stop_codon:yes gene_type:complete
MSINEQQERFCQSYILHRNASEAARAAGYAKDHAARQGHRLLQSEEILDRIENLEKELSTEVDVVPEIENQYTYAKANGHTNSAIKALELLSRVRGAKTNKDIDLDPEKLEETTVDYMKVLGKDIVMKMVKKAGFI